MITQNIILIIIILLNSLKSNTLKENRMNFIIEKTKIKNLKNIDIYDSNLFNILQNRWIKNKITNNNLEEFINSIQINEILDNNEVLNLYQVENLLKIIYYKYNNNIEIKNKSLIIQIKINLIIYKYKLEIENNNKFLIFKFNVLEKNNNKENLIIFYDNYLKKIKNIYKKKQNNDKIIEINDFLKNINLDNLDRSNLNKIKNLCRELLVLNNENIYLVIHYFDIINKIFTFYYQYKNNKDDNYEKEKIKIIKEIHHIILLKKNLHKVIYYFRIINSYEIVENYSNLIEEYNIEIINKFKMKNYYLNFNFKKNNILEFYNKIIKFDFKKEYLVFENINDSIMYCLKILEKFFNNKKVEIKNQIQKEKNEELENLKTIKNNILLIEKNKYLKSEFSNLKEDCSKIKNIKMNIIDGLKIIENNWKISNLNNEEEINLKFKNYEKDFLNKWNSNYMLMIRIK